MFGSGSLASGGKVFRRHGGRSAPVTRPAHIVDVVKKLRSLESFQGLSEDELSTRADELTDPDKLWSVYFSGVVLDPAREHIERNLQGQSNSATKDAAQKAHTISVKLRLEPVRSGDPYGVQSYMSLLLEHYGALRASLLVGDTLQLEWSTAGLVIPAGREISPTATNEDVAATPDAMEASVALEAEIVQEFEATHAKKEHIEKLIAVVSRYNKGYFYHPIFRSCQTFAANAMSSLGYTVHPKLEGNLGGYFKEIKKGMKQRLAFGSHADLDTYVDTALKSRGVALPEAEYLMSQYFTFHVQSMTECRSVTRWQCAVQSCCMPKLNDIIELRETVAFRMLQSRTSAHD